MSCLEASSSCEERFIFEELISKTGYGEIWVANDLIVKQRVAIKKIERWFSEQPGALDALRAEVVAGRRVGNANVLRIYDLVRIERHDCLVMEYLEGCTLHEYLLNERPSPAIIRRLIRSLCHGLSAIHAVGLAHRDLKPNNIIVDDSGNAVIIDLGMVGKIEPHQPQRLPYHAPELLPSLITADIYALGGLFARIGGGDHEPPCADAPWLDPIIAKCRQTQPEARYSSAERILEDIDKLRIEEDHRGELPRSRRLGTAIALSMATILVAGSVLGLELRRNGVLEPPVTRFLVVPGSDDTRSQMLADLIGSYLEVQHKTVTRLPAPVDSGNHLFAGSSKGFVITVRSIPEGIRLNVVGSGGTAPHEELLPVSDRLPLNLLSKVSEELRLHHRPDSQYDPALDGYTLESLETAWRTATTGPAIVADADLCKPSRSIPVGVLRAAAQVRSYERLRTPYALNCATFAIERLQAQGIITSQTAILRARLLQAAGNNADAVGVLRSAADTLSTTAPIYRALSESALQQGFGMEARNLAQQAIRRDPLVSLNYVAAGKAAIAQRHDEEAQGLLLTALSLDRRSDKAYSTLGSLCIRLGRFQEAKEHLEKAVGIASSPESITALGLANILCGNSQEGVLLLSGAAAQNPNLQTLATLGAAFRWVGNSADSNAALVRALQLGNENSANGLELGKLAIVNAQLGRFKKADQLIRDASHFISALDSDLLYCSMVVDAFAERKVPCVHKFQLLKERHFLVALALRDPQIAKVLGPEAQ